MKVPTPSADHATRGYGRSTEPLAANGVVNWAGSRGDPAEFENSYSRQGISAHHAENSHLRRMRETRGVQSPRRG